MSENISNNLELQREIDLLKKKNKSLEKDLEISRKINLDSLQENEKLKQALKMVMTQSRIEFDKTATIIGYSRQKQILQEMFEEQRTPLLGNKWPPLPTSPQIAQRRAIRGRGEDLVGLLTQGSISGSCRWCYPGLMSDAPLGLYKEEAASCRFTNFQSLLICVLLDKAADPEKRVCATTKCCQLMGTGLVYLRTSFRNGSRSPREAASVSNARQTRSRASESSISACASSLWASATSTTVASPAW